MNSDFALGFIAGEGTFTVKRKNSGDRVYLSTYFQLRVKENDRRAIDNARESFGGIGTTRFADGDMYNWRVENKGECLDLVEQIEDKAPDCWWDTEKGENFDVWADIVRVHAGGPSTAEDRLKMARIARDSLNNNAANAKSNSDWDDIIDKFEAQVNENT